MKKKGLVFFVPLLILVLAGVVCYAQANGGGTPGASPAKLATADTQFLTDQCKIGQPDVDAIPKLSADTQQNLLSLISRKDCTLLQPFIASRSYFMKLDDKKEIPLPPVGWSVKYLTETEYQQYLDILNNAPW
jgi:hypothetical protein